MSSGKYRINDGYPYPLGATVAGTGVNFALYSHHAEKVELCLFDESGAREIARIELRERTEDVWHVWVDEIKAGQFYGYRVYGAYDPKNGHRFNHHKLLIDPYAKQLSGTFRWSSEHYAYNLSDPSQDLSFDRRNNARFMPKSVVTDYQQPLQPMVNPIAWNDTIIYETHVRGYTKLQEKLPAELRGTYLGLAQPSVIDYLVDLGITSVELLPVHAFVDEHFLVKRNLVNYWGYNTLSFFSPHGSYLQGNGTQEFRTMVDALHEAGLEVILDVVYNHTAEGNHLGPTLCYRGIDNKSYYSLQASDARYYVNDTGCGNTVNVKHPRVLQMVMDSLRYWSHTMGVDGFRFDLAPVLGREASGFDPFGGFFDAVRQDPVLNLKKMIAEPWDIGPGGYQLSNFPPGWSEWNDRYRDTVRRYWRGDAAMLPEFARRIHGSSDLFEHNRRKPSASVNFVTSHDGFNLCDLVSYNQRHNHANKEDNNDGHHTNFSFNFGVEGPTKNQRIETLRKRQQRNFLATLLLSQGTPMLLAGDEIGHSQQGNNNAYCQDNETTWIDWASLGENQWKLRDFVRNVIRIRREFPLLRSRFYIHKPEDQIKKAGYNIHWYNQDGEPMKTEEWSRPDATTLGWMLESVVNARCVHCLLILYNSGDEAQGFALPTGWQWVVLLDTTTDDGLPEERFVELEKRLRVQDKSMVVLYGLSNFCEIGKDVPAATS